VACVFGDIVACYSGNFIPKGVRCGCGYIEISYMIRREFIYAFSVALGLNRLFLDGCPEVFSLFPLKLFEFEINFYTLWLSIKIFR